MFLTLYAGNLHILSETILYLMFAVIFLFAKSSFLSGSLITNIMVIDWGLVSSLVLWKQQALVLPPLRVPPVVTRSSARCFLMVWAQRWLCAHQASNKLAPTGPSDSSGSILCKSYFLSRPVGQPRSDQFCGLFAAHIIHIIRNYRPLPLNPLCGSAAAAEKRCLLCPNYVCIQ